MLLLKSVKELKNAIKFYKTTHSSVGFVPTMGALHSGHISLVERCKKENDTTICSIFINPLQFNDKIDFIKYPVTIEKDIEMLINSGVDILFLPDKKTIYPENFNSIEFDLEGLDNLFEGEKRPGHFKGVANVLKIFFEIITPDNAYFGQKDFQQTLIVKKIVEKLNLPINIKICEIIREDSGLAMSSRNSRLNEFQRKNAKFLFKILNELKSEIRNGDVKNSLQNAKNKINLVENANCEYLEILNRNDLSPIKQNEYLNKSIIIAAVNYCNVRLIDNIFI